MGFKLEQEIQLDLNKTKEQSALDQILQKEITLFGKAFSDKKKEDFYTEMSVLLNASISLKEALTIIQENQKKPKDILFYKDILNALISGKAFSEAIRSKKEITGYEYHSLKMGEETGTMAMITQELGTFYGRKNEQRRILINALTYPMIILITAILVVVFMLRMVVPMFQDIFSQNQVELPWITKLIISASNFIGDYGWFLLCIPIALLIFKKTYRNNPVFKRNRDRLLLGLPYFGKFLKSIYLAQFTQAVSLLTTSKVPVLNCIQLVKQMIDFYPLKNTLETVEMKIIQGQSLSESLKENRFFDNRMVSMVKVAEETNQTEFIFERLNQQYSIEVAQKSKLLSTLLEPFIILIVGLLVGIILVAMYLPMFKLSSVLG